MTEMACSGHERIASSALASWPAGTSPSMAVECPSTSSRVKIAGAIMAQRVCPWHRSGSTCTFTCGFPSLSSQNGGGCLSQVEVVPLEVAARVHPQLHAGDIARLVGGEEQHRVADVDRLNPRDRHGLLHVERRR